MIRNITDTSLAPIEVISVDRQHPNIFYLLLPNEDVMICDLTSGGNPCLPGGLGKLLVLLKLRVEPSEHMGN